jgi:hypothetical protein
MYVQRGMADGGHMSCLLKSLVLPRPLAHRHLSYRTMQALEVLKEDQERH